MSPLLLVAAESREFSGLLPHGAKERKLDIPVAFSRGIEVSGQEWILVANGPGPRLAWQAVEAAAAAVRPRAVVSTGFCGALDPELPLYGIISATAVQDGDRSWACVQPLTRQPFVFGTIVSLDRVAGTPEEKVCLRTAGQAAVEMEAAAIGEWTAACGLPFSCVRVVTDGADEGFFLDFNRVRDADGRFSRTRILAKAARNPVKLLPELIRLDRRCRVAARLLGDFLADCRF
ncbi:MAG: hypothetical protein NTY38_34005 [Acidobacteria bacterium]|nr:hypothetical protein [Acidobacteriota bacterium]